MPSVFFSLFALMAMLAFSGCTGEKKQDQEIPDAALRESFIRVNQKLTSAESEDINLYMKRKGLKMQESGTGLRYSIVYSGSGEKARPGQLATVKFRLGLLNGKLCYSSDSTGTETFRIDQDEVESGLHEGIKLMRPGDRAKFILPSHLAHGLAGDHKCIPAKAPVIYDIELIELK